MSEAKKNILILVEGAKTDVKIMEKLFSIYGIDAKFQIVPYCTNIYTLYKEMFSDDIDGFEDKDIRLILRAREKDLEKKKILDDRYTDILLVFDLDPHDPQYDPENIKLMQKYFSDSSDMGQLYLNYPMVEAFYHLESIPDDQYCDRKVFMTELKNKQYKSRVQKETRGNAYSKFANKKDEYTIVILQNLAKALFLINGQVVEYNEALELSSLVDLNIILQRQVQNLEKHKFVYVLCTCIFFIMDYNRKLLI
ncbi:hypothetical protein [Clostridium saccharoperbutylacetonicum]|uniref:hypothetical protein n=1 Tax=Clostridium saccharoperbutylacetonicum TaxID=36745 RepID=UPI0039EBFB6F